MVELLCPNAGLHSKQILVGRYQPIVNIMGIYKANGIVQICVDGNTEEEGHGIPYPSEKRSLIVSFQ